MKINTIKEIPGLKYLMKLFQNKKLESKLNDLQSFVILFFNPPFLKWRTKFPKNCVREENDFSEKVTTKNKQRENQNRGGDTKTLEEVHFLIIN